jgi:hypothetical protein
MLLQSIAAEGGDQAERKRLSKMDGFSGGSDVAGDDHPAFDGAVSS